MSKIKNDGLDQCGAGPFERQQFGTAGIEGVNDMYATDMASWREGGRQATVSEGMLDGSSQPMTELTRSLSAEKSSTSAPVSAAAADLQKQSYMMANSHYPPFPGPLPPYMAMRPGLKPPGPVGPVPFHMPMMPPNYSAMMMSPFVSTSWHFLLFYF